MIAPGIRVARGPNWIWNDQDDGEGHIGTVCELGRAGSTYSPEKTVIVNWDSGNRSNYRVGYQDQFDLIVVDNAQIGVRHANIICDGCSKSGLAGIRFRCAQCPNFDLCSSCYGDDVHDLNHEFIRFQTANSAGVRVPPRAGSVKVEMKGIFVGAKVVQGHDWEWGGQDGGKSGLVVEIRGWDNISCRSVANVSWVSGSTNVYRLGHKGNVDLKYIQPASGGFYYRDHMPILGKKEEQQPVTAATRSTFTVGDRVKVCLDRKALINLQQGHGGWNPRMAEYLNKVGCVHRITDKGDIRVQYENCSNRWTFHPAALIKVCTFQVGDIVTIDTNAAKIEKLQKGHGEWVETMRNALGKTGKVTKVYTDGDLRVQQLDDGFAWTLNPKCVKLERSPAITAIATERSNSMMDLSHQRTDHVMTPLSDLSGTSAADKLVREAALGRLDYVKQYLDGHSDQVDCMSAGKTCLQVAAHQGHINIIKYLLSVRANVNIVDKEGDSTLHYAAFGNQPEIMKILLMNGAHINVVNSSRCSALHISAHKKPPHCVKVLLEFGANVNIQDSYGDTALHDAIGKENTEVVELLCNAPNLDLTVRNNRGFNALHHASLKGNVAATRKILQLAPQLVDIKKNDGFAPLHLASLNGHSLVVDVLVREGKADINIRNNRRQTPFLLAVAQGHTAAIEKLIDLGCDVLVKDEDGDNAMHLCVIKKSNLTQEVSVTEAPKIHGIYQTLAHCHENRLMYAILCYLAQSGCQVDINNKGNQILHWILDKEMQDLILSYVAKARAVDGRRPGVSDLRSELEQTYSNIQALNLSDSGSVNNSFATELDRDDAVPGTSNQSNPPTPMRRQQQRDQNASPLNASGDELSTNQNLPKKTNHEDSRLAVRGNTPVASIPNESGGVAASTSSDTSNLYANADNDIASSSSSTSKDNNNFKQSTTTALPNEPCAANETHHSNKIINQIHSTQPNECIVCNEILSLIIFEPCSHQIACGECSMRMKKCLSCGRPIEHRRTHNGKEVPKVNAAAVATVNRMQVQVTPRQPAADDRLRYLESKIMEFEETHSCSICMERVRDVAFLCGHSCCSRCAETLKTCHMCRKQIVKKINLY